MRAFVSAALLCCCLAIGVAAVPQGRIIAGKTAMEGQFPYQVSLKMNNGHICGGSIISRSFILTAAHCAGYEDEHGRYHTHSPKKITVLAGAVNRLFDGVELSVAAIKAHKDYADVLNDIALLQLTKPLNFSKSIQPIPLTTQELPNNVSVIVSGWGEIEEDGEVPIRLQWSILKSISRNECAKRTRGRINFESIMCLSHNRYEGICKGDSGGPAAVKGALVGVAAFVAAECGGVYPDGYTKVFSHLNWIKAHTDIKH